MESRIVFMDYVAELEKDLRFQEAMHSCLNCGICCAICPAAEFYNYDPRMIVTTVQRRNNEEIEALLKSNTIWYCGQCMSCKTRCPRGNAAGMIIQALRALSQKCGFFTESEKRSSAIWFEENHWRKHLKIWLLRSSSVGKT